METSRLPHPASYPHQSGLCRRVCLWAPWCARDNRGWPQTSDSQPATELERLGDFDQRPPRRIHYVGGVRKESAADCGQCQRDELFGTGLCPSGWSTVAGPVPLCPLWPEAPSVVRRQQDLLSALCLPRGV